MTVFEEDEMGRQCDVTAVGVMKRFVYLKQMVWIVVVVADTAKPRAVGLAHAGKLNKVTRQFDLELAR